MKATIDIPEDLYRSVKARSAIEGRPLRSVAVELFQLWLAEPLAPPPAKAARSAKRTPTRFDDAPWLAIARRYVRPGGSHDWANIKESIARGWGADAAGKLRLAPKGAEA